MLSRLLISTLLMGIPVWLEAQGTAKPATAPAGQGANAEDPFQTHEAGEPTQKVKAADLLQLKVVGDMLVAETRLRPGGPQLVEVEGLASPVSVTVRHRTSAPEKQYVPDSIDMSMLQRDGDRVITTLFTTTPGNMNLSRSIETPKGEYMVQFIQNSLSEGEAPTVTLFVQSLQDPLTRAKIVAESFSAFARSHPSELTQNVRPMLEAFSPQPRLFAVSDELGAQVFPEAYRADEATRTRIAVLVKQLGDESFAKRKQASDELEKLGTRAATELALLDRSKLDPEQLARVDAVLTKTRPAFAAEPQKLRSDVGFLLDCMMSQTPQLRKVALEQLRKTTGRTIAFDEAASEEQRITQVYKLRAQLLPASPATMPASATK